MNTTAKPFILQYTIRFENGYDCSGGYVKLFGSDFKALKFNEKTPYYLMFGPDVCKPHKGKLYFLINRNDTTYDNHKFVEAYDDELTHSYTLIIQPNRSYEIRIDGKYVEGGDIDVDFALFGSEMIADPDDSMPDDWDNRETIVDSNDVKPRDWDDREYIVDPLAKTPTDWNERVHGKWEPPTIENPNYKGVLETQAYFQSKLSRRMDSKVNSKSYILA